MNPLSLILSLLILLVPGSVAGAPGGGPEIRAGVLDLRHWDFDRDGSVPLSGQWRFKWGEHLPPDSPWPATDPGPESLIKVPGSWNGRVENGNGIAGDGFATYRIKVLVTPQKGDLALKVLDMATAFRIYINGILVAEAGDPGKSADTTMPGFDPGVAVFAHHSDTLDILVHISNFHHWQGGMWESLTLGTAAQMRAERRRRLLFNFFLLGAIFIMGAYHLGGYLVRTRDKSLLYFGLFCLLMGIRVLFTGERAILDLVPGLAYEWLCKVVYLAFYGCVPLFAMYVRAVFPGEIGRKVVLTTQILGAAFSALVLSTPARIFSYSMPLFQAATLVVCLYGIWAVARSARRKQNGAGVFLSGFAILFITAINDILYTRQIIDTGHFSQIGFFLFIFSQAILLYRRFAEAFSTIETQGLELKTANEAYEKEIHQRKAAERQTAESEKRYRLLAENVTDTLWILDLATMTFDYVSPSVERSRGFTAEEAKALSLEQSLSAGSLARVTEILGKELEADDKAGVDPNRSRTIELQHSLKKGGFSWAEIIVSFIRDEYGRPKALLGVSRDISERKRVEAQIVESEKKYRDLFENGSDLLCIHDLKGVLLETNLHFKEEYGWTRQDVDGLNIRDMMPEKYRGEFDRYMDRILATGADEGLLTGSTKSGAKVLMEYRNRLIRDSDGAPVAVQGAARDITERFRAGKALRESEEKYKELVQHAPAGIYEFDMETLRFISVNDVMCQYTGYTEAEFLALDPFDILVEESKETLNRLIEDVFNEKKREISVEYRVRGKNGREFWVLSNARFFYENGAPKRAMAVVHDMTQVRRGEAERRELEIKLHNAKKLESLGTLAGGVAHDLNNILSGILSYPDLLLLDLEADSHLRAPLLAIRRSGEKAAEIVQDLLTLARRGGQNRKVVNLNQLVSNFLNSPEFDKIISASTSLRVETRLSDDVLNILGSEVHIAKTVMNLVANAAEAMPAGGDVIVATSSCYLDKAHIGFETIPNGEYTTLEISDTGIGISPSDLEHIFEPFYTKKAMGRSGTGLGMSVVWGTVKDHDGFVDIVTAEGSGTTFILYFPVTRMAEARFESVHIEDYLGRGESILVIDDSAEQRELAGRMLQRLGYAVAAVDSGEAAVAMIQGGGDYDLLVLDMIMAPGMDGLATYRQILGLVPGQRAVIASGFAETEMVRSTQDLGAGPYVRKPYTLEKIGLAVRSELDRSR